MGKKEDLTGRKFFNLRVLLDSYKRDKSGQVYWWCHCLLCDNIVAIRAYSLKTGHAKSCGCLQRQKAAEIGRENKIDLTGKKFGHLTVIEDTGRRNNHRIPIWKCQCDCKNKTIVFVSGGNLKSGAVTSCGHSRSKGEEKILSILQTLGIKFETQKTFKDCINPKTKRPLRFDFYLPDYNVCIEYDGEQHFSYTNHGWNNEANFEQQKNRDKIKQEYCNLTNIKLVHIPYWDYEKIDSIYLKEIILGL